MTTDVYNYITIKLNLIYCNHAAASVLLLLILATLLLHTATHTVYVVTPVDHYYPNTTCHHCHNLQHYLLNVTKYFTSNTQLLFLPGLHYLHIDLIIQNVHNISLIGSTANSTTLDGVIIQCNSSGGITMSNITDLTMENLVIDNCRIEKNVLQIHHWIFWANGMIISHCYNVQLQNITVYRSDQKRSALLVINILGISSFINITSNGLKIEYNEVNVVDNHSKLLLRNYQIPLYTKNIYNDAVVVIYLLQESYVTGFAKRGLPHTSNLANLMCYNCCSVCASYFKLSHNVLICFNILLTKFQVLN